jgi:hypothetical protein
VKEKPILGRFKSNLKVRLFISAGVQQHNRVHMPPWPGSSCYLSDLQRLPHGLRIAFKHPRLPCSNVS